MGRPACPVCPKYTTESDEECNLDVYSKDVDHLRDDVSRSFDQRDVTVARGLMYGVRIEILFVTAPGETIDSVSWGINSLCQQLAPLSIHTLDVYVSQICS